MSKNVDIRVSFRIDNSPYRTIIEKAVELDGTVGGFEELVREALERTKNLIEGR